MNSLLNAKRLCGKPVWYISGAVSLSLAALTGEAQTEQKKNQAGGLLPCSGPAGMAPVPFLGGAMSAGLPGTIVLKRGSGTGDMIYIAGARTEDGDAIPEPTVSFPFRYCTSTIPIS